MNGFRQITLLGDSILKGVQVDPETKKYITCNRMGISELEQAFDLQVENAAHFGATVDRGGRLLERMLVRGLHAQAVVMDFGGNDCDYCWGEISAHPAGEHLPKLPLPEFKEHYRALIRRVRSQGAVPVLMTLPPLEPQRFFDWWCRGLDRAAVLSWLGDIRQIFLHQESYSQTVEDLAREEGTPLVDVRSAFLCRDASELLCEDGTHPNSAGQAVIAETFRAFASQWETALETA